LLRNNQGVRRGNGLALRRIVVELHRVDRLVLADQNQRFLVSFYAVFVHFRIRDDTPLLNEPEQQRVNVVLLEFGVQGIQVESPKPFRSRLLNVEDTQEMV
jgi:hypothetical protein